VATIRVLEHAVLSVREGGGPDALTPNQARALTRLERELPKNAIRWGHHSVRFSQYCGVLNLGADTIEILPKIAGKEGNPDMCQRILLRMLYVSKRVKTPPVGTASINLQKNHLLDIFTLHFCEELFQQLRKGALLRYVSRSDNLPVLRGKLLIEHQLKFNIVHKERLFCEFSELVEDNEFNQYIKCALQIANSATKTRHVKRKTTELLWRFDAVQDRPVSEFKTRPFVSTRDVNRFEYVFQQCDWFIKKLRQDVVTGENQSIALMFDMNRLFEEFLALRLKKSARRKGYRLKMQQPQKYLLKNLNRPLFKMKPDMVLLDSQNKVVEILDTKWKLLDKDEAKYGISQSDIYQMIAYGTRYNCNRLTLIYPKQDKINNKEIELKVQESGLIIRIVFVDLEEMVELGTNYQFSWAFIH
jgi:5-methylcytosine-specific restriction enzyme subunit McrC